MKSSRALKGLLLFPGAGSDSTHASLLQIEQAVAPLAVRRADFAYRKAGRRPPDRAPILLDTVRTEAVAFAAQQRTTSVRLVLGGRSMGGRMCSMAVAGGDDIGPALPAAALVLIAYPLHPPGRPDKLRVEHLARLPVPCLFVHGTRDAFGTPDELQHWTASIPAPVTHVWLPGKTHDLKGADADIAAAVSAWLQDLRVTLAQG
ncbi:unannotated protein [freshwater metagenome]|uniref:Unannotated protein n=1 Tax=freshwater metagenome TaxID=449393 RepID=A0A6J7EXR2_9ZZZZ|nr:dienelactone hydrolase [Actinomycetota bacterium]